VKTNRYFIPGAIAVIVAIGLPVTSLGDVYRWKDERGYVHFSSKPPADVESKKISSHSPEPEKPADTGKPVKKNSAQPQVKRNPDLDALLQIVLPPNASKRQVRDYVQQILLASRDQRTYLASDPQVGMLIEVGPKNVDVLIDVTVDGTPWSRYPVEAISRLATNAHKTEIIEALPSHYYLSKVVLHKRWCREAKPYLLEGMRDYTGYLPGEWIRCVASLKDPATYPDLKFYLENGWNRHTTYGAIRYLPGIDLDSTLQRAWDNALTKGNRYEVRYLTPDTVRTGYLPAMDYVVNSLDDKKTLPNAHAIALRHLDVLGNNREIREWYTRHRSRLVYDVKTKRFTLPK
jgi:hypothetical protein